MTIRIDDHLTLKEEGEVICGGLWSQASDCRIREDLIVPLSKEYVPRSNQNPNTRRKKGSSRKASRKGSSRGKLGTAQKHNESNAKRYL